MNMLFLLFNVVVTIWLITLIIKVLTIEKYLKKNQGYIADLLQLEIDKLSKENK